jgi:hypothetical protein
MKMTKQRPLPNGEVAMDCGVCTIAMLADLPYEKVLADNPNYREISDRQWMCYLQLLGFQVDQQDENDPPRGCGYTAE